MPPLAMQQNITNPGEGSTQVILLPTPMPPALCTLGSFTPLHRVGVRPTWKAQGRRNANFGYNKASTTLGLENVLWK